MKNLSNDVVIHVENDIAYLQYKKLLEYDDIIKHAYTLKKGNMDYSLHGSIENYQDIVIENYKKICGKLGLNYINVVRPYQTHTNNVQSIYGKINKDDIDIALDELKDIDGVITDKKEIILSTLNADCILFLIFDPKNKVIASVHSGWKGTLGKIIENTINKMVEEYNSKPEDILVAISPSIRKCHFEVHDDVKIPYEETFKYTNRLNEIIEPIGEVDGKQKYKIDTVLVNKIMLIDMGIKEKNILDCEICSLCNCDQIHSRRGSNGGLFGVGTAMISLI